ncbi:GP63, leishmanolysin [Leishmania tarentolae]|uniref:GP63, leishmanolysin n=1 Tax=Leishmania tarentolae TaxID=5689 RepID=A0A640KB23_LEITA|nr:GP63, leishmanolysin [Leishmania tarentolae]
MPHLRLRYHKAHSTPLFAELWLSTAAARTDPSASPRAWCASRLPALQQHLLWAPLPRGRTPVRSSTAASTTACRPAWCSRWRSSASTPAGCRPSACHTLPWTPLKPLP